MEPYYRSEDGAVMIYHARYEDVLAASLIPVGDIALIHDDPPYGVNERTDRASKGRGKPFGSKASRSGVPHPSRDFPPIVGDDQPFDPSPILHLERRTVLWGANYYTALLPRSPSWILWDKRTDIIPPNDNADGELAWSNLGGPLRIFRHMWSGLVRASEKDGGGLHLHPTQKPIALCTWIYQRAKLKRGDLVLVPHLGSGPDLPAARAMGLRIIGCDVEEWCCRTAVARLREAPHPEPVAALGPLFGGLT